MDHLADVAEEFDKAFEKSRQSADHRPWAHPAQLPLHPDTHSDRHPDDPDQIKMHEYF